MKATMRAAAAALAIGLAASGLTACTDDSEGDAGTSTTTALAPEAPAAAPIDCGDPVASFAPMSPMPDPGDMPSGTYMAEIEARGRLIAGVSADTLLFGYRNPFTGNLEGFDIDQARAVANAIFGNPDAIEYKAMTYAQRIPSLLDGSVDIVADVMTINCARWDQISFSSQYFSAGQKVLVETSSEATGIESLDGQRVCAATGSTNIEALANYPAVIAVPVDDISDCMVLFQQGEVDAVTGDDTVLAGFVAQDPYAKIVGDAITSEPYGLGVAKTHPEFVSFVNGVLAEQRSNGEWAEMYVKWLQPTGPAPDPPVPTYGRTP